MYVILCLLIHNAVNDLISSFSTSLIIPRHRLTHFIQVDWDAVATIMNYKSGSVASQRFGQVRKRLGWTKDASAAKAVKTRAPSAGRVAKPGPSPARKPATKKLAANNKPRAAPKTLPKLEESDYEEEGHFNSQEDKSRDLMAPFDNEGEQEEMSMQDKVARGDFDSNFSGDGELPDSAFDMINSEMTEKELQNQIAQEAGGLVYEEYDAYDSDARWPTVVFV